jgi:hypothetical protein
MHELFLLTTSPCKRPGHAADIAPFRRPKALGSRFLVFATAIGRKRRARSPARISVETLSGSRPESLF